MLSLYWLYQFDILYHIVNCEFVSYESEAAVPAVPGSVSCVSC